MSTLIQLSEYFRIILPIFTFIVLMAFLFLILYAKTRIDIGLASLRRLSSDASRIASALEERMNK